MTLQACDIHDETCILVAATVTSPYSAQGVLHTHEKDGYYLVHSPSPRLPIAIGTAITARRHNDGMLYVEKILAQNRVQIQHFTGAVEDPELHKAIAALAAKAESRNLLFAAILHPPHHLIINVEQPLIDDAKTLMLPYLHKGSITWTPQPPQPDNQP
ncbi:MAG: hypothetical protein ACYDA1_00165 [Vulcanimicrobiaceae bacterium]